MKQHIGSSTGTIVELGAVDGQNAVALAQLGYDVVAIVLVPSAAEHGRHLAQNSSVTIIEGDFYTVELDQKFDAVCYWDGFGIGTDDDQQRLLRRIAQWLKPTGFALIEVYGAQYWAEAAGRKNIFDKASRQYDFDHVGQRMLDRWWPNGREDRAVTQSLRCYTPNELENLLTGTGLTLDSVQSRGAWYPETKQFVADAPIDQAMQYLAKVTPSQE